MKKSQLFNAALDRLADIVRANRFDIGITVPAVPRELSILRYAFYKGINLKPKRGLDDYKRALKFYSTTKYDNPFDTSRFQSLPDELYWSEFSTEVLEIDGLWYKSLTHNVGFFSDLIEAEEKSKEMGDEYVSGLLSGINVHARYTYKIVKIDVKRIK